MSVFSKTIIERAKRFSPQKTTFQENILDDFFCILKIGSCRKTEIIAIRKTVKLRILSSVETSEALKSENGVKTNRYK